jgi:hypothetical protein
MTDPFTPGTPIAGQRSIVERAMGAAQLDVATYEEVEADRSATGQAAVVVAVTAVASAIGGSGHGTGGMIAGVLGALLSWAVTAGLAYFVGTRLFGGTADWGELLRTLGFAQAPRVLNVLGIIPVLGPLVMLVVWLWVLVTQVVAIRQALDVDTGKAILTAVVSSLIVLIPVLLLGGLIAGAALAT